MIEIDNFRSMRHIMVYNQRSIILWVAIQFKFRKKIHKIFGKISIAFFILEDRRHLIVLFCFVYFWIENCREAEEQAEKIALEIESQTTYKERTDIENCDENEEAKFAAVERPQSSSTTASGNEI